MTPIVWLYITVVVVISFSIMVLCIFISLLLVTVGIVYVNIGKIIRVASISCLMGRIIQLRLDLLCI